LQVGPLWRFLSAPLTEFDIISCWFDSFRSIAPALVGRYWNSQIVRASGTRSESPGQRAEGAHERQPIVDRELHALVRHVIGRPDNRYLEHDDGSQAGRVYRVSYLVSIMCFIRKSVSATKPLDHGVLAQSKI
jgi:hypothetical protein